MSTPGVGPIGASVAAVTVGIIIAQQVAASAARDAFFLANYPASALPGAMIASSILSMAFLPVISRLMARFGPAAVIPWTSMMSAMLFVGEWVLSLEHLELAAAALFIHTMVFGSVLISGFWSLFNERFDPHTAKHAMGRVAGGAALGGVAGALLVERAAAASVELTTLLPVLAAAQVLASIGCRSLGRGKTKSARSAFHGPTESFFRLLSGSSYLRDIALLVTLTALVSTLTSFLFKAQVARTYVQDSELLRFFARYYLALGLIGFLLQINLTRLALNRFGLAITIAMLPASVLVLASVAIGAPALWSMVFLRGVDEALSNSLFRSGYELLYTPIASGTKRRFKAIIDVGFDRLGKTVGSGLVAFAIWMFADTPLRVLLAATVVGATASLLVALRLRRGYVASLTRSLRSQAMSLGANALGEALTLRTIAGTRGLRRNQVIAALGDLPPSAEHDATIEFSDGDTAVWGTQTMFVGPVQASADPGAVDSDATAPAASERDDRLLEDIAELRSGDPQRVRKILGSARIRDRHLVPHVVSLLGTQDIYTAAVGTLRGMVEHVAGQLVDVLLDQASDPIVRRRLPQVLAGCRSEVAIVGLMKALDDVEFEVRFRSAGALVRTREAHSTILIAREAVFDAVVRECRRGNRAAADEAKRLELLFRILSLALEPEPLRLAEHAFRTNDSNLRGTALEYLETVLPPHILAEISPLVGAHPFGSSRSRTTAELESELRASSHAVAIDLAALRRELRRHNSEGSLPGKAKTDN